MFEVLGLMPNITKTKSIHLDKPFQIVKNPNQKNKKKENKRKEIKHTDMQKVKELKICKNVKRKSMETVKTQIEKAGETGLILEKTDF